MSIKGFPPSGTRPAEKTSDSGEAKPTAEDAKNIQTATKDVFEKAKNNTIEQLVSKSKAQDLIGQKAKQLSTLNEKPLEPAGDCEPMTRVEIASICIAANKLEPVADGEPKTHVELPGSCIPMNKLEAVADGKPMTRVELAGLCIAGNKLEPVADCEPMTRTIDRLKQQHLVPAEKRFTKPEK